MIDLYKQIKKARTTLLATVIAMIFSGVSLSFISILSNESKKTINWTAYLIAICFWLGIISAVVCVISTKVYLSKERQKLLNSGIISKQVLPGAVCFGKGKNNIIIYSIFVIGLALIVSDIFTSYVPEKLMYPIISITIISFSIHCVIDGKYYKVYKIIKESVENEAKY